MDSQMLESGALERALAKAWPSHAEGWGWDMTSWDVGWSGAGCGPKEFQVPRAESGNGTARSANKVGSWDMGWGGAQQESLLDRVEMLFSQRWYQVSCPSSLFCALSSLENQGLLQGQTSWLEDGSYCCDLLLCRDTVMPEKILKRPASSSKKKFLLPTPCWEMVWWWRSEHSCHFCLKVGHANLDRHSLVTRSLAWPAQVIRLTQSVSLRFWYTSQWLQIYGHR